MIVRELAADLGLEAITVRQHVEALTSRGLLRAEVGDDLRYRPAIDLSLLRATDCGNLDRHLALRPDSRFDRRW